MHRQTRTNPFRPHSPVVHPRDFYGRSREIRRVLQFLRNGQSVSVVGPPRCGKTSLLNYVADMDVFQRYALIAGEHVFVRIDVLNVGGHSLADLDQGECLYCLREEIVRQIRENNATVGGKLGEAMGRISRQTAHFGLRTLFRVTQANGLKPIVTLDNFDVLARNTRLEASFFSALRALATGYDMAYLVASEHPLHELEEIRPEASTLCGICQQIVVGPFTPQESQELVAVSLERAHVQFLTLIIERILRLGCNQPHRLQLAGYHAFEIWQQNGERLREIDCQELERRFKLTLAQE